MPALVPAAVAARIVWLGLVGDRAAGLTSSAVTTLRATYAGPEGEAHGGLVRAACARVAGLYPRGAEIRNVRQVSVMSAEDLAAIAARMGVERLDPALLGTTMVIEGIPDFSRVPPSSRLQADGGATLVVDMENRPCTLPARSIEAVLPGKGRGFRRAAAGRRGVSAWVEREGLLRVGGALRLFVPDQPVWAHLATVRRGAR